MTSKLPCPACGFLTCEENYSSFIICVVCGWEDDGVQLANPCSTGGANIRSLAEQQERAIKKYPLSVRDVSGVSRGTAWRPLNKTELESFKAQTVQEHWRNTGILSESEAYWRVS